MTGRLRGTHFVGVFVGLLVFTPFAAAAEESSAYPSDASGGIFLWINFVLLAGAIVWLVRKHGRPLFRTNAERISSEITRAAAVKAQAEVKLREAEAKLARLEEEVAELRAEAQREAAAEAARLRELARSDAEKISHAAQEEIAAAERAARLELKAIAAKLAVDGAESLLVTQLTPQTQGALLADFVNSLPGRPN
jgi:F0F1-type ATP synthase membrane subunit b/b'